MRLKWHCRHRLFSICMKREAWKLTWERCIGIAAIEIHNNSAFISVELLFVVLIACHQRCKHNYVMWRQRNFLLSEFSTWFESIWNFAGNATHGDTFFFRIKISNFPNRTWFGVQFLFQWPQMNWVRRPSIVVKMLISSWNTWKRFAWHQNQTLSPFWIQLSHKYRCCVMQCQRRHVFCIHVTHKKHRTQRDHYPTHKRRRRHRT